VQPLSVQQSGYRLCYQDVGPADGPVVVLVHGLVSDNTTWAPAMAALAARGVRVIAPDLLGHGASDKPACTPAAYSLDGFATSLRELLVALSVPRATVVGHSLGGAIAMHFAYHYPAHAERLVLVASGGLGKAVHPVLRAAAVPGSSVVLRLLVNDATLGLARGLRLHRVFRLPPVVVANLRRAFGGLAIPAGRDAFFVALRAVISPSGQRGSMIEMRYLGEHVPTLIVWSERDHVIPVTHARALHEHLPTSRLELFPGSSHQPHCRYPERFAATLADFLATTDPAPDPVGKVPSTSGAVAQPVRAGDS
jgi:pimeloyl-ACP methyl ester carboxylesterase